MVNLEYVSSGVSVRYTPYSPCHKSLTCGHCAAQEDCVWCPAISQCFSSQDNQVSQQQCGQPMNTTDQCTEDLVKKVNQKTDYYRVKFHSTSDIQLDDHQVEKTQVHESTTVDLGFLFPYFGGVVDRIKISGTSIGLVSSAQDGSDFQGPDNRMEIMPPLKRPAQAQVTYGKLGNESIIIHWRQSARKMEGNVTDHVIVVLSSNGAIHFVVEEWEDHSNLPTEVGLFDVWAYEERNVNVTDLVPFIRSKSAIEFKFELNCDQMKEGCISCQEYSSMCKWDYLQNKCVKDPSGISHGSCCTSPRLDLTEDNTTTASKVNEDIYQQETFYKTQLMYHNTSLLWAQARASQKLEYSQTAQTGIVLDFAFSYFGYSVKDVSVARDGYIIGRLYFWTLSLKLLRTSKISSQTITDMHGCSRQILCQGSVGILLTVGVLEKRPF